MAGQTNRYFLCEEEKSRINIVKFLAIVLVVFLHSYSTTVQFSDKSGEIELSKWLLLYQEGISNVIARVAVPLFFFFSALLYFASEQKYFTMIKKKCRTIFFPYLFWNTFWIAIWIVLQQLPLTEPYFSGNNERILNRNFFGWLELYGFISEPLDYPLWFMRDLFVVFLISPIIRKIAERFPKSAMVLGFIILLLPNYMFMTAIAWFFIGAGLVYNGFHIKDIDKVEFWKIALVYFLGFWITLFLPNFVVRTVFIFTGVVFWIRLSKLLYESEKCRKIVVGLSKYTFIIFAMHELTLSSVKKICLRLLPNSDLFVFLEYNMLPILVIAVCILIGFVMSEFMPKFYVVVTGGRIK